MSKRDKIELKELESRPEALDGNHRVIPIVTGEDDTVEEVAVPEILPVLTLRSSVLFRAPLPPSRWAVREHDARARHKRPQRDAGRRPATRRRRGRAQGGGHVPHRYGRPHHKILEMPNGNLTVILNGLEKVEIGEYVSSDPYLQAKVTPLKDSTPDEKNVEFNALVDSIRDVALNIINISPQHAQGGDFRHQEHRLAARYHQLHLHQPRLSDEDRQSLLEAPGLLARSAQTARNPDPRPTAHRVEERDPGKGQAGDRQAAARLLPPAADAHHPGRTGRRRRRRTGRDARKGQAEELAQGGGRTLREGVAETRTAQPRRSRIFGAGNLPATVARTAVERLYEGQSRPQTGARAARSRPFRPRRGQGAVAGTPGGHQVEGRPQIADPLSLRPSGRRQDLAGQIGRSGAGA